MIFRQWEKISVFSARRSQRRRRPRFSPVPGQRNDRKRGEFHSGRGDSARARLVPRRAVRRAPSEIGEREDIPAVLVALDLGGVCERYNHG